MKKSVLVRNSRHQRPLYAVLTRYGVGQQDKYNRGLWITPSDLSIIEQKMPSDKTAKTYYGTLYVYGTNMHNLISIDKFVELFEE